MENNKIVQEKESPIKRDGDGEKGETSSGGGGGIIKPGEKSEKNPKKSK